MIFSDIITDYRQRAISLADYENVECLEHLQFNQVFHEIRAKEVAEEGPDYATSW